MYVAEYVGIARYGQRDVGFERKQGIKSVVVGGAEVAADLLADEATGNVAQMSGSAYAEAVECLLFVLKCEHHMSVMADW